MTFFLHQSTCPPSLYPPSGDAIFYAKRSEDSTITNEEGDAIFYAKRSADNTIMNEAGDAIFYERRAERSTKGK